MEFAIVVMILAVIGVYGQRRASPYTWGRSEFSTEHATSVHCHTFVANNRFQWWSQWIDATLYRFRKGWSACNDLSNTDLLHRRPASGKAATLDIECKKNPAEAGRVNRGSHSMRLTVRALFITHHDAGESVERRDESDHACRVPRQASITFVLPPHQSHGSSAGHSSCWDRRNHALSWRNRTPVDRRCCCGR